MMISMFDCIILIIFLTFLIIGVISGFIKIIINLISFVVSIFFAIKLYEYIKPIATSYYSNEVAVSTLSAVASYVISSLVISIINSQVIFLTKAIRGGFLDRTIGLTLGGILGVCISNIMLAIIMVVSISNNNKIIKNARDFFDENNSPQWVRSSFSFEALNKINQLIIANLPSTYQKTIENIIHNHYEHKGPQEQDSSDTNSAEKEILPKIEKILEEELNLES